jgi:hypothetical protein
VQLARRPRRWWAGFERWVSDRTRPALLRWEALPGQVQVFVTYPVMVALLFPFHVIVFDLAWVRSLFYALFWGIPATAIVYIATRAEAAKRHPRPPRDE